MIDRDVAKRMVGAGWADLLDLIYDRLPKDAVVMTVKEKWGGLRIYVDGADWATVEFICAVEDLSHCVCEVCGKPGKSRRGGWIRTLCDECVGGG